MKDRDPQTHHWSEADVDSLLTEFFRAEMPTELSRNVGRLEGQASRERKRPEIGDWRSEVGGRRSATTARRRGFAGLGAAVCAMVLAVMALSSVGRNLVTSKSGKTESPKESQDRPDVAAKKPRGTDHFVVDEQPLPPLPPELQRILPPELRSPADNAATVNSGDDDPLDLRDLLRIEVFEPRDGSKRPRVPRKRRRLPEER